MLSLLLWYRTGCQSSYGNGLPAAALAPRPAQVHGGLVRVIPTSSRFDSSCIAAPERVCYRGRWQRAMMTATMMTSKRSSRQSPRQCKTSTRILFFLPDRVMLSSSRCAVSTLLLLPMCCVVVWHVSDLQFTICRLAALSDARSYNCATAQPAVQPHNRAVQPHNRQYNRTTSGTTRTIFAMRQYNLAVYHAVTLR